MSNKKYEPMRTPKEQIRDLGPCEYAGDCSDKSSNRKFCNGEFERCPTLTKRVDEDLEERR